MIYILSWTTTEHQKTLCGSLHTKLKIQGHFKDLHRNLRSFEGKWDSRTFQGLPLKFKDFSRLCQPCDWVLCKYFYTVVLSKKPHAFDLKNVVGRYLKHSCTWCDCRRPQKDAFGFCNKKKYSRINIFPRLSNFPARNI